MIKANASIKKNTIFNAIKTLSSIIFPIIIFPYISRVLLPDNVGKINFGTSIVSYFSFIASLGMTTYAIRECSAIRDNYEKLSNTASQIYSIHIVATVIAYIMLAFTLLFCDKLENYRTLIVIQSLNIVATTVGADWLNSAMEDFKYITIRSVACQCISLLLIFLFVKQSEDYMKYAMISLISSAGANTANIWYRRKFCQLRIIWDIKNGIEWKRHLSPILILSVMILSQQILNNLDVTMLGLLKGDWEVGLYSTALKIYNIVTQVILSITWVVLPRFSIYFNNKNYGAINLLLEKVTGFSICLGVPCIVGLFFLSEDILIVIAGQNFKMAANCLSILSVSIIFMILINIFGNLILLPQGKDKKFTTAWIVAMTFNIISNVYVIPRFGIDGAALTTVLANMIVAIILMIGIDKEICYANKIMLFFPPLFGSTLVAMICIISTRLIENSLNAIVVSMAVSVATYMTILLIFRYQLMMSLAYSVTLLIKKYIEKKGN